MQTVIADKVSKDLDQIPETLFNILRELICKDSPDKVRNARLDQQLLMDLSDLAAVTWLQQAVRLHRPLGRVLGQTPVPVMDYSRLLCRYVEYVYPLMSF
jgi:hypothetical protein